MLTSLFLRKWRDMYSFFKKRGGEEKWCVKIFMNIFAWPSYDTEQWSIVWLSKAEAASRPARLKRGHYDKIERKRPRLLLTKLPADLSHFDIVHHHHVHYPTIKSILLLLKIRTLFLRSNCRRRRLLVIFYTSHFPAPLTTSLIVPTWNDGDSF